MIVVGGRRYRMAGTGVDLEGTLDPGEEIIVSQGGQAVSGGGAIAISGAPEPSLLRSWWPWILLAAAGALIWYLAEEEDKEGASSEGPFVG